MKPEAEVIAVLVALWMIVFTYVILNNADLLR